MTQQKSIGASEAERRRGFSTRSQGRVLVPMLIVWGLGTGVLLTLAAKGAPGELFLDPSFANGGAWYVGMVSQVGILCWTAAFVSAAFGSWVARKGGRTKAATFLKRGAVVTALLLLDDLIGLHSMVQSWTGFGKPVVVFLLVSPCLAWLVIHARDISRTRTQILVAALTGLISSGLVDLTAQTAKDDTVGLFIEDSPKFLGILAWVTYFVLTTVDITRSVLNDLHGNGSEPGSSYAADDFGLGNPAADTMPAAGMAADDLLVV